MAAGWAAPSPCSPCLRGEFIPYRYFGIDPLVHLARLLAEERRAAEEALRAMPFPSLLYARVDLIEDWTGRPVVLELTEPSLFFAQGPGSAGRLAGAILGRLDGSRDKPKNKRKPVMNGDGK